MTDATVSVKPVSSATNRPATIRPEEAAHFGALAQDWWDPKGSSAMLHRMNPVRLGFIREAIDLHWAGDIESVRPLAGKTALDVGCGAGLLCEPLARMGADVTGVDAAAENVAVAAAHAQASGVAVDYRAGELGKLGLGQFDLVTCLEVIEHVADKPQFIVELAGHLAPGGLMILSTPNRTVQSRLLLVEGAEALGMVPKGTHHWDDFITPDELCDLLSAAGLDVTEMKGIAFGPIKGLHLSDDTALNYILTAQIRT
jgi:2-polyprenyl-6-hydroxyphenyl methylase/3-demethylubiquinone-9 3-methyltransferase